MSSTPLRRSVSRSLMDWCKLSRAALAASALCRAGIYDTVRLIPALSKDWQGSMQALLDAAEAGGITGNAGLGLGASAPLAWPGFRPVVVVASREESADVRSFELAAEDGSPLPPALPGQHIMVRMKTKPGFSRRHSELFPVRSAWDLELSDWRQE